MKTCRAPNCIAPAGDSGYCQRHYSPPRVVRESRPANRERLESAVWKAFSRGFLERHPFCVGCGDVAKVTDHRVPFHVMGGDTWDDDDYQPLCLSCHGIKTAAELKRFG